MNSTSIDPELAPELVERVLAKLGLSGCPTVDLNGLNQLYAAWSGGVPFDNVQKRIWFAGDRTKPLTGGRPTEFFENWLRHGTGGTCWPTAGAICALAQSLGFNARRIAGAMIEGGEVGQRDGHGSTMVTLDGVDFLIDPSILAFEAIPLVPGVPATAGKGIHAIQAVPIERGFDVLWYPGHQRDEPIRLRTQPEFDPVDHSFFIKGYDASAEHSPFNDALHICRRSPNSIASLRRNKKTMIAADGTVSIDKIADADRPRVLIEEFSLSQEIVEALPHDTP